jgi:hypothetical protein
MWRGKMEESIHLKSGLESPKREERNSIYSLEKKPSLSSVEFMNSSQESFLKEDVIEELKQQNNILRSECI